MKWRNLFPPIALIVMSYNLTVSLLLKTLLPGISFVGLFFFIFTIALAHKLSFWQLYFANVLPNLVEYLSHIPSFLSSTTAYLPSVLTWLRSDFEARGTTFILDYLNLPTMITLLFLQTFCTLLLSALFMTILMKIVNHFLPKRLKSERLGY